MSKIYRTTPIKTPFYANVVVSARDTEVLNVGKMKRIDSIVVVFSAVMGIAKHKSLGLLQFRCIIALRTH